MSQHHMQALTTAAVTIAAAILLSSSCKTEGTGPGENPAIAISVTPSALTVARGSSGSVTATITRSGGYTGTVTITTEGAPNGVTAAVSNVSTSGGITTGTVTITAGAVVLGPYQLTIRAAGSGVDPVTTTFELTVAAEPEIELLVNPAAVSAEQGATAMATITIDRTNFAGEVGLAVEGAPVGVSPTLTPQSTTGTSSALTLAVGAAVTPGSYDLTIRGTATGLQSSTAQLSLTVTAPVQTDFLTFITTATFTGDIKGAGGLANAIASADALCQSDAGKPAGGGIYKAMLADDVNRVACTTGMCSGGAAEHVDWVFKANANYYQSDGTTLVFTADANGVFDFSTAGQQKFGSGARGYWTGLGGGPRWTSPSNQFCDGAWASDAGIGDFGATHFDKWGAIGGGAVLCTTQHHLLCVEQ